MTWDDEFDVVSAGSGAGGVTAALASASLGGRALVLEKDTVLGGVTAYSGGQLWLGATRLAEALGIHDSAEATSTYLEHIGAGFSEPDLRTAYIEAGWEAERFLAEVGIELQVIRGLPDYFWPHAPGSAEEGRYLEVAPFVMDRLGECAKHIAVSPHGLGIVSSADWVRRPPAEVLAARERRLAANERASGTGMMAALIHAALERGVEFRMRNRLTQLVREDGRVVGAVVETPDGVKRIRARKGVVLATGGYDWNPGFMRNYEHLVGSGSMTPPTVEGDHLVVAGELGAAVASFPPWSSPFHVGFIAEGMTVNGGPGFQNLQTGQPNSIVVDTMGERFGDESFSQALEGALAQFDGRNRRLSHWPCWLVFDDEFYERFLRSRGFGTLAAEANLPTSTPTADTIRELAMEAGIEPDGLVATVARWNEFCEAGDDTEFHRGQTVWANVSWGDQTRPNPMMGPIARAPFRALPLMRVGVGIPSAGLRTDGVGQVIDLRGRPIEGLHAVGNSSARLETGAGYNSGIANARGVVFGLRSARHLHGVQS